MDDRLAAIAGTKSLARLDEMARTIWEDWGADRLTEQAAQALAEAVEARRRKVRGVDTVAVRAPHVAAQARAEGRPSCFPPKRRQPTSPDREASKARRRTLAASGPMPATLAAHFTTGEQAVLRIVADQVRDHGDCRLTQGEIAARAGVCVTTARDTIRAAARDGLLTIEERRQYLKPNLPNVVRIISREWRSWITRGRRAPSPGMGTGGGSKKLESTTTNISKRGDFVPSLTSERYPDAAVRVATATLRRFRPA